MSIGYIGYVACLFLLSGAMLLLTDAKTTAGQTMTREIKTAKVLGWVSLVLACASFAAYWVSKQI